jgi:hypothetical protein
VLHSDFTSHNQAINAILQRIARIGVEQFYEVTRLDVVNRRVDRQERSQNIIQNADIRAENVRIGDTNKVMVTMIYFKIAVLFMVFSLKWTKFF